MADGSSWPLDLVPPPWSAGASGGAGFGLARPPDRCRGPADDHPLAGQAGPPPPAPPDPLDPLDPLDPFDPFDPPDLLDGRGAGRLTGGADPPARLWLLTGGGPADGRAGAGGGGADDAARGRDPVPAER